jgi:hypothetical protein
VSPSAYARYQTDPIFHALTDQFRALLYSAGGRNITPSDIRAAALLAATMHEMENIRPIVVYDPQRDRRPEVWEPK